MTNRPRGLFAGLCTFDLVQSVDRVPGPNEKAVALEQAVAAGGPATNASVAFAFLGGHATLVTGIGRHPLTQGQADVVLIDGHHPRLALAAAGAARKHRCACVLDGGSWKAGTADLLPLVDVAVCSADFRPPGTEGAGEVLDYLLGRGVRWAVITDGARPVTWAASANRGEIDVPAVDVTDTLAAGDIFHGAFAHAIAGAGTLDESLFTSALRFAAELASHSCRTFGPRSWMRSWTGLRGKH